MSSILELLKEDDSTIFDQDIDQDLSSIILDFSQDLNRRIEALNIYSKDNEITDFIYRINGMYQMSGIRTVEMYLYSICVESNISPVLKLMTVKSLIEYKELIDDDDNEDDKLFIEERNKQRLKRSGEALEHVCEKMSDLPTPCRVEALEILMSYTVSKDKALKYFNDLVSDQSIECEFRYKTILGLEKIAEIWFKDKLKELFNTNFVKILYELNDLQIKTEFSGFVPKINNQIFFEMLVDRQSYTDCRELYNNNRNNNNIQLNSFIPSSFDDHVFPNQSVIGKNIQSDIIAKKRKEHYEQHKQHEKDEQKRLELHNINMIFIPCVYDFFIYKSQYNFLFTVGNMIYYKILSAQYLLQNCTITNEDRLMIEGELTRFAEDINLDYDRRADAADVLLQLGSPESKIKGRAIIIILGHGGSNRISTIFSNAQNVHTTEVEKSVSDILEFFVGFPIHLINKKPVEFEYICSQVKETLRKQRPTEKNEVPTLREDNIILAMNRIYMDRVLYSKYNNTLSNIFIKVWSYLIVHESCKEMYIRFLEELEEMSGTCSTGFVSRMVNVVSGFGEFSLRISWGDQIVANFSGRLNAIARNILSPDSLFRGVYLESVIGLWLNDKNQEQIKKTLINIIPVEETDRNSYYTIQKKEELNNPINLKNLIDEYLVNDRDKKIEIALEDFSTAVLDELTISTLQMDRKLNLSLFFRSSVARIREEMYQEFTEHVDDSYFDLWMRKAIIHYEGV
jgi:hypothetical protein